MAQESLPRNRPSRTHSFHLGDVDGRLTFGFYPDGRLGEISARVAQAGTSINGLIDAACIVLSLGLQHGVPVQKLVETLRYQSYPPAGATDNPDIRLAASFSDYLAQVLEQYQGARV